MEVTNDATRTPTKTTTRMPAEVTLPMVTTWGGINSVPIVVEAIEGFAAKQAALTTAQRRYEETVEKAQGDADRRERRVATATLEAQRDAIQDLKCDVEDARAGIDVARRTAFAVCAPALRRVHADFLTSELGPWLAGGRGIVERLLEIERLAGGFAVSGGGNLHVSPSRSVISAELGDRLAQVLDFFSSAVKRMTA